MNKKIMLMLFLSVFLSGCVRHQSTYRIVPSTVPEKRLTKTADTGAQNTLPDLGLDPWQQCALTGDGEISIVSAAELKPEEFSRRVRITFAIQEDRAPMTVIMQRCMNGKVYTCLAGIGDHCVDKIDLSTDVNETMKRACSDPTLDGVTLPPAVVQRTSAYEWICQNGEPVITQQIIETDAAGYDRSVWFEIPAPEEW